MSVCFIVNDQGADSGRQPSEVNQMVSDALDVLVQIGIQN